MGTPTTANVRQAGSLRAWAREHQVNVGTVSKALANRSDLTSPKILAALGVGRCIR